MVKEVEEWRRTSEQMSPDHWYEVSNLGRVRAVRILKPFKTFPSGNMRKGKHRLMVSLHGSSKKGVSVHRLVASVFCERGNGRDQVNHKDGNPINNRCENLEWVTAEENNRHAIANKLHVRGSAVFNNKIDPAVAIQMRRAGKTFTEIGAHFGASLQAAKAMLKRMGEDWPETGVRTKRARPKNGTYTIVAAKALLKRGWSFQKMARHFGISDDAVRMRFKRNGLL